jgi:hypothetical protein
MNDILNVRKAIQLYQDYSDQYGAFVGITPGHGIQITRDSMIQVAPLPVWNLNTKKQDGDGQVVYYHELRIDGVLFFARTSEPLHV